MTPPDMQKSTPLSNGPVTWREASAAGLKWTFGALVSIMFLLSLAALAFFIGGLALGGDAGIALAQWGERVARICVGCSALAVLLGLVRLYVTRDHSLTV